MATRIQIRRDTAANWTSNNPTLARGEQGFETDTYKLKIGDGVTAWNALGYFGSDLAGVDSAAVTALIDSDYVSARSPAPSLEVQNPAVTNEYYIYVGNPANKLATIQSTRGNVTNLTFDQSFATLQEALNFVQSNTLKDVGYSDNRGSDMGAAWVLALEPAAALATQNASGYFSLQGVAQQVILCNQNSLNPVDQTGSNVTFEASSTFVIYGCNFVQIHGDMEMPYMQIGRSNIKPGGNYNTAHSTFPNGLWCYDGSTVKINNTASFVSADTNSSCQGIDVGSVDAKLGSTCIVRDVSGTSGFALAEEYSYIQMRNYTCTGPFSSVSAREHGKIEITGNVTMDAPLQSDHSSKIYIEGDLTISTGGSVQIRTGSELFLGGTFTHNGPQNCTFGGSTIANTAVASAISASHNFFNDGVVVKRDNASPSYSFYGLSTSDPSSTNAIWSDNGVLVQSGYTVERGLDSAAVSALIDSDLQNPTSLVIGSSSTKLEIGSNANAGASSIAIGSSANASAVQVLAVGSIAEATGEMSVAIGPVADATGSRTTSLGHTAQATANYTTAVGWSTQATQNYGTSLGYDASVTGLYGTAVGANTTATGLRATALGYHTDANGNYSVAIGTCNANAANSICISAGTSVHSNNNANGIDIRTSDSASIHYSQDSDFIFGATVTAPAFVGDGSGLTGLSAGLDSAAVTTLIDSDYISARVTIPASGLDSAAVISLAASDIDEIVGISVSGWTGASTTMMRWDGSSSIITRSSPSQTDAAYPGETVGAYGGYTWYTGTVNLRMAMGGDTGNGLTIFGRNRNVSFGTGMTLQAKTFNDTSRADIQFQPTGSEGTVTRLILSQNHATFYTDAINADSATITAAAFVGDGSGLTGVGGGLGLIEKQYSYEGTLSVNTGDRRLYLPDSCSNADIKLYLKTPSVSGSVVVDYLINDSADTTLTIPQGQSTISATSTTSVPTGSYITFDITSAGSGAVDLYALVSLTRS